MSTEVKGVTPGRFLQAFGGQPRGFWSFGGNWLAHAGSLHEIEIRAGEEVRGGRFQEVRRRLAGLGPPGGPWRVFGGFAFGDQHEEGQEWQGFPSARFVLPRVELEGRGEEGGVLTLRGEGAPGGDAAGVEEELRIRLEGLAATLEGGGGRPGGLSGGGGGGATLHRKGNRDLWLKAVARVLSRIEKGEVEKVVLARSLEVRLPEPVDPDRVALRLWEADPQSRVFLFEPVPGRSLVGAAPEVLAELRRGRLAVTAVAGSAGVGNSPQEREVLGRGLLASEKDLLEHRLCVQDIVTRLRPLARSVEAEAEPRVVAFSTIQHLETRVEGDLDAQRDLLSALETLHPTPAVCGFPRDGALAVLQEEETFPRGWYAGPVGWMDDQGNGVFVPALRSAVGGGREWTLFAGAGIVAGSSPEREWEETRLKFRPVLRALGVDGEGA